MTLARPWLPILVAGCVWLHVASAQTGFDSGTSGGTTGSSSGTSGSTTGTNSNDTTGGGTTGGTDQKGTSGGGTSKPSGLGPVEPPLPAPSDPFGFGNPLPPSGPPTPGGPSRVPGASSTFGYEPRNATPAEEQPKQAPSEVAPKPPTEEAPTFTAPSFYGAPKQVLTAGQGRLARPRFRYYISTGAGFDDNTQQTPDLEDIPDRVVRQVIPGQPEQVAFRETRVQTGTRFFAGTFQPVYGVKKERIVLRPAVPEQVVETKIPGVKFRKRNESFVSTVDGHVDAQWMTSRGYFTMDARAGAQYYWNRAIDPLEFNGSLSANYLRKLGPRSSLSGSLAMSYQSQTDYSQVNVVDTPGSTSSYFVGNLKLDLSYRWAARFSTVTSLTGNTILYQDTRSVNSYWETGIGNEFRWMQSARTTWVAEVRYDELQYLEGTQGNVSTAYLLGGADWTLSRRTRATLRLGDSVRTFEEGGSGSSPYGEASVSYQPTRRDQFTLTGRYGFEQTSNVNEKNVVARFSANYSRTFTPRLVGSLGANFVDNQTTAVTGVKNTSDVIDGTLVLQYMFTRKFSMNARYSYTLSKSSSGFNDYDRSRIFLTGEYEF